MKDFEEVFATYEPMASAIIRKLHIYRDFENFRQAASIALWQAWCRYDESKGAFAPFAYRSMHGAMLDELKKETKFRDQHSFGGEELLYGQAAKVETDDMLPGWVEALGLKMEELEVLHALFVQGKSVAELSRSSHLTLAGMKKKRERLLRKIKSQLEEAGGLPMDD